MKYSLEVPTSVGINDGGCWNIPRFVLWSSNSVHIAIFIG
jgi:hypothetical protein